MGREYGEKIGLIRAFWYGGKLNRRDDNLWITSKRINIWSFMQMEPSSREKRMWVWKRGARRRRDNCRMVP